MLDLSEGDHASVRRVEDIDQDYLNSKAVC